MNDLGRYHPDDLIDPERAAVLLAYANQIDPRIQVNAPTRDVWSEALHGVTLRTARTAIVGYYAKAAPDERGFDSPPLRPSQIRAEHKREVFDRQQEQQQIEQAESRKRAVPMPEWFRRELRERNPLKAVDEA